MKAIFELSFTSNDEPCIRFRHYYSDTSLQQKVQGMFIETIKENGCLLKHKSGTVGSDMNPTDMYELVADNQ